MACNENLLMNGAPLWNIAFWARACSRRKIYIRGTMMPPWNRAWRQPATRRALHHFLLNAPRFATKESATHAIVAVHNTDINGQPVKCSWGKESGDPNNTQAAGQVSGPLLLSFVPLIALFLEYNPPPGLCKMVDWPTGLPAETFSKFLMPIFLICLLMQVPTRAHLPEQVKSNGTDFLLNFSLLNNIKTRNYIPFK